MHVLITGSTGFVGSRVTELAKKRKWKVTSVIRKKTQNKHSKNFIINSIDSSTDWSSSLEGVDCVIHCAAQTPQSKQNLLATYRETNTFGTLNLANQAAKAGVKRFVFISSIKVNGELSEIKKPFKPDLDSIPLDPYGLSKYEAEVGLAQLSKNKNLEVIIIRSPLVYGPGVKANFLSMMRLVDKGIPLPLSSTNNEKSLVYLDNLSSLILTCCEHPSASGHTFLVSDDYDVSTTQLIKHIAHFMKKPLRLVFIPMSWIQIGALILKKEHVIKKIFGNLQVNIDLTKNILGWEPPFTFDEGIKITVEAYLQQEYAIK
ncbi:NAD-dependent epimerase/dehydratase family protein [Aliivibrio fischeri]|uniref:NAD-dependent epimerase/dehydratase family protein n=1 Tax=Aliivibrio fischeri TaxID=668 RepID=UPI0012DAD116|nr:NAD-dependent epimerase/dehydratase family protein [Aliivibrio fischeri]MUJ28022.1 NAD-dependent epimerase/dehydratase family protein [Aliivibrio fischeri]